LGKIFADDSTAAGGAMTAGEVGELDDVRGRGLFKTLALQERVLAKNGLVILTDATSFEDVSIAGFETGRMGSVGKSGDGGGS
jgi:hypothetical protein